jgi:hypothetical protein
MSSKRNAVLEGSYFGFLAYTVLYYNFVLLVLVQSAVDRTKGGMQPHNRT